MIPAITPGIGQPGFYVAGLAFAGLVVLVAMLAVSHQRGRAYSASLVYLLMGLVAAGAVAALDAPWLGLVSDAQVVERLSELCVVVALFGTGLRLDRHFIPREWRSTALLLGIAMPLTMLAVTGLGVWVIGLSWGAAIVLGAALALTDPVLAGDLGVSGPGEGDDSEPRFALTSEAGFNDGLAFPIVFLGLLVAGGASQSDVLEWFAVDVVYGIAGALLIGALAGTAVAAVAFPLRDRDLMAAELDEPPEVSSRSTARPSWQAPTASWRRSSAAWPSAAVSATASSTGGSTPGPRGREGARAGDDPLRRQPDHPAPGDQAGRGFDRPDPVAASTPRARLRELVRRAGDRLDLLRVCRKWDPGFPP